MAQVEINIKIHFDHGFYLVCVLSDFKWQQLVIQYVWKDVDLQIYLKY